ncbi:MAG: GntR family transcriptional regulator [Enterocloster sp.]
MIYASALGCHGTPVRDALRLLQEQGFAETIPYRGTYVTLLSLDNIKQMIYMRVAVETMVLRDFLEVQTPDGHGGHPPQLLRMQKAVIREPGFEPEQFYRMDAQMHSIWFAAVRRQKLWEMLQAQQLHYTRFRMLDFITETDFTRIIGEHEDLFASESADKNE